VGEAHVGLDRCSGGETEAGIAQMHESTAELQRQQANLWVPQTLLLEAEILGQAKQYGRAHQLLNEAQALIEPLDQRFYEAELHRVRGVIMISDSADLSAGVASLDRAIDVAWRQNAKFLELRAKMSKARFLVDHGLHADACNLLAPIYVSFRGIGYSRPAGSTKPPRFTSLSTPRARATKHHAFIDLCCPSSLSLAANFFCVAPFAPHCPGNSVLFC